MEVDIVDMVHSLVEGNVMGAHGGHCPLRHTLVALPDRVTLVGARPDVLCGIL